MKKTVCAVVCLCMILSCLPTALAAAVPEIKLTCSGTVDEDRMLYVDIRFCRAVGLNSWDIGFSYDESVLDFRYIDQGADAVQMAYLKNNNFSYEENLEKKTISGYFLQQLWSVQEMEANIKAGKTVTTDPDDFHAFTIAFAVKNNVDIEQLHTDITVSGEFAFGAGRRSVSDSIALADLQPAHVHSPGEDADCGHDQVCLTCGEILSYATGLHTYGEWTRVTEPDCLNEGSEQRLCITCAMPETRSIPALGHEYGTWIAIRYATERETGLRYCLCIRCKDPQIETLEKLAAQPGDTDGSGTVEAADARLALRMSVRLYRAQPWQEAVADVTGDFAVSADDARLILRRSVHLESAFPVEK